MISEDKFPFVRKGGHFLGAVEFVYSMEHLDHMTSDEFLESQKAALADTTPAPKKKSRSKKSSSGG